MLYKMPEIEVFYNFILKFRILIITLFIIGVGFSISNFKHNEIITNESFWMQEKINDHSNLNHVTIINFNINEINKKNIEELKRIQKSFTNKSFTIETFFNLEYIKKISSGNGSEFFKVSKNKDLNYKKIIEFSKKYDENCYKFIDGNTFIFYIYSDVENNIKKIDTFLKYKIIKDITKNDVKQEIIYSIVLFIILLSLFYLFFKNIISGLGAVIFVIGTTLFSLSILNIMLPNTKIHISMLFIIVSISLLDYIFFYFRWHVFHRGDRNTNEAMKLSLKTNLKPAFWTSAITVFSLGILLYSGSNIIKLIALISIIPSLVAYFLNIFLFPSIFSFFTIKNPHLGYRHLSTKLAENISTFNKKIFDSFVILTIIIGVSILIITYFYPYSSSNFIGKNNIIIVEKEMSIDLYNDYKSINSFSKSLKTNFNDIVSINSINNILENTSLNQEFIKINEENFYETEFLLDLFSLKEKYIDDNKLTITILLSKNSNEKSEIIKEINKNKLYFISDIDSNIINIKDKNLYFMTLSMLSAIFFIGILMGFLFNNRKLALIGSFVNTIPIIIFTFFIMVFKIPITIELFIAMAISLAISTDSTIHFNFRYWKSRLLYNLSKKDSLEEVFFYSGIPIIISMVILILSYVVLLFSNIESLRLLGIYTILIMIISLIVDFFILPIFLMYIDKDDEVDIDKNNINIIDIK